MTSLGLFKFVSNTATNENSHLVQLISESDDDYLFLYLQRNILLYLPRLIPSNL